ncbi:sialidase family protein [Jiulongibacter sediminis]|uniref:Sialidase n=1 Tax=Jiulongibacter sediminis TaxID=1605367 RepID=A0A0P7C4S0_9BACT|nr:sialidase family protein [Jiulongibacter sediminis]KPM49686.1 sialidase [Jiulongibacter sediminis]TBX26724.1 sialidase [Jiulongibacter sediminis]
MITKAVKFIPVFLLLICLSSYGQSPLVSKGFIYDEAPFKSCHASTVVETPYGIAAAWFGGTHEKHKDVEIYFSRKLESGWTSPASVANGIQHASKRYPTWNPVLFQMPEGPLLLFYKVGPDPRNWWGEMKESTDGGLTWSEARRLPEDILGPVKNKPILTSDGRLLCPSSKEFEVDEVDHWQVFIEETSDLGKTWTISKPLNDGVKTNAIQPSILTYPDGRLQMLGRSKENRLMSFWSNDQGNSWSEIEITNIPNPNSGTDAVSLSDGRQLLVYNPTERYEGKWGGPRTPLSVAISKDGENWEKVLDLETEPGEYSYPAVIQSSDGKIHITYTYKRSKVRYVVLTPENL